MRKRKGTSFRYPHNRHVMPLLGIEIHAVLKLRATATGDERLLHCAHRDDLWFLVSHFWLLSESFDSLLFLYSLSPYPTPAGRS